MIIGGYPCCDKELVFEVPDVPLPVYHFEKCPHCGEPVWHVISRINPVSYMEADFLKLYEVDEINKKIKEIKK